MNICIISGSPRKNSNSLKVAKAIEIAAKGKGIEEIYLVKFDEYDIPLMANGDLDENNLTQFQQQLKDSMDAASLIFIISPEYNWMPSAELINFIHQMTDRPYASMWSDKVFAIAGSSNGRGGKFPTVQLTYVLNKINSVMHYDSIVVPRVFESQFTQKALDENGQSLGNEEYDKGLNLFVDVALKTATRWNP